MPASSATSDVVAPGSAASRVSPRPARSARCVTSSVNRSTASSATPSRMTRSRNRSRLVTSTTLAPLPGSSGRTWSLLAASSSTRSTFRSAITER
jgi:hypothetical protein